MTQSPSKSAARYRFNGHGLQLTVIDNTLHFLDTDNGVSYDAVIDRDLPAEEDAFDNALYIAVGDVAKRGDVLADEKILQMVVDTREALGDHHEAP